MPKEKPAHDHKPSAPPLPDELLHELGELPLAETMAAKEAEKTAGSVVDSAKTDAVVDDITAKEADELLAVHDAEAANIAPVPRTFGARLKSFFAAWWNNKWARYSTMAVLAAAVITIGSIPASRYYILNTMGVRSSASLIVLDGATKLPLKNVQVSMGGQQTKSNVDGVAKLQHLRLGPQTLSIKRLAFAPVAQHITVGWGSNPLGEVALKATGDQYVIVVQDYLSGKPIAEAEATSHDLNALSDQTGKIILTLDATKEATITLAVGAEGYRKDAVTIDANKPGTIVVPLVTSRKEVFVSKQSGKYDVYTMDIDGQNRKLLLAGTGLENNNLSLAVSPAGDEAALVSTRDDMRDNDGYRLSALTIINVATGAPLVLDHAEQIQQIDWIGNHLVYQAVAAGASASNPQRYRLMAYDYKNNKRVQLAAANQFNSVISAGNSIYYANSSTDPTAQLGLFKINPDGTGKQRLFDQEVWSGFRINYSTLNLQTPGGWYAYTLGTPVPLKISAPAGFVNHQYIGGLWVDSRDGKGVLLQYSSTTGKDTALQTQDGLTYPVRWLTDKAVVYRVVTSQETADYVISTDGGHAKKITDVTNTYGFSQGY
ncbi:MAG TPA: hypothetical protein VMY99_01150 [Nevskiaceae bacterium]|nr:hypothetical protein [Nevskiaceae bacterium]